MQRFVNDPDYVVEDMLKGFLKAHGDLIVKSEANDRVVKYINTPVEGKVGLVTGGGSGHEPAFLGYVGKNMVDAVAVGEVFSSPSAQAFYDAFMEADAGKGVACLFGNYAGDNMNVKMAVRKAKKAGVTVKYVPQTMMWLHLRKKRRKNAMGSQAAFLCGRSGEPGQQKAETWMRSLHLPKKQWTIQEVSV